MCAPAGVRPHRYSATSPNPIRWPFASISDIYYLTGGHADYALTIRRLARVQLDPLRATCGASRGVAIRVASRLSRRAAPTLAPDRGQHVICCSYVPRRYKGTVPVNPPLLTGTTVPSKIAVVAAHPDDEVIGVGGQLGRWTDGSAVFIVNVTDGASRDGCDAARKGFSSSGAYGYARHDELEAALSCLSSSPAVVRFGFANQQVVRELRAVFDRLAQFVRTSAPDVVITHCYEGGHPDHDALAVAVSALARHSELPRFAHLEFSGYHGDPHGPLVTGRFPAEPQCEAARCLLTPAEQAIKRRMLNCFRSQERSLAPFGCTEEWLRRAPAYDFMKSPTGGCVWYDRYSWRVRPDEWRARVRLVDRHARGMACSRS